MKQNFVFLQKLRTSNCSLLFALCSLFFINCATAQSNTPFSKYGVVQNVQNYSSNPFWSPDAPYNQRMPTAVYAKGPDVETADCQNIVAYLVAAECANRNKCVSSRLLDVRPSIVLQLSQMSGGSYVTACAGYIDAAFDQYKKQNAVAAPSAGVAFPVTTGTGVVSDGVTIEKQNPFSPKLQEWQMEILDREQELKDLQAANGVKQPQIVPVTEFPTTYADLPFSERMGNAKTGYEPFKGVSAYKEIKVESEDSYMKRQQELVRAKDRMEEFCKKYPNESECRERERRQKREETSVDQAQQQSGDSSGGVTPSDGELPVKEGEIVFKL